MTLTIILLAAAVMFILAIIFSYILGWANEAFHVEVDPRIEAITSALPGANCGGCGFLGCADYAAAIVEKDEATNKCPVGGSSVTQAICDIMGVEASESAPLKAMVKCGAHSKESKMRAYRGEKTCLGANFVSGVKECTYGCLGFGDCVKACCYDALTIQDGLATIHYDNCVGCGACTKVCPRSLLVMIPFVTDPMPAVACANQDAAKDVKAACTKGCIACKMCERKCDLYAVSNNLAAVKYDDYTADRLTDTLLGMAKCPNQTIRLVGDVANAPAIPTEEKAEAPTA